MPTFEDLAPDQRAVLQMVLQRGRGYDQIAGLLAIDRAAVRKRALDGFDALAGTGAVPALERALITDYLLGQLPPRVADEVHGRLAANDAGRAWALAVAGQVEHLATNGLPEIPVPDDATPAHDDATQAPAAPSSQEPAAAAPAPYVPERFLQSADPRAVPEQERPVSRRPGALLLASIPAVVLVVAVIVVALTVGGGHKHPTQPPRPAHPRRTRTNTTRTQTTGTAPVTTTAAAGASASNPRLLAALNLSSPSGSKAATGLVQVIREQGRSGIVLVAQGVPANQAHNAYAVWLKNSHSGASKLVGYVQTKVRSNGKLETEGKLPSDVSGYDQILVTLETQPKPAAPGEIVLSGPFREARAR